MVNAWNELNAIRNEWDALGYEHVPIEKILGKNYYVLEYELFESGNFDKGIRILLADELNVKKYIVTFATVLVRAFKDHPDEVKELIDKKIPMCIIEDTTPGGRKFYTFQ